MKVKDARSVSEIGFKSLGTDVSVSIVIGNESQRKLSEVTLRRVRQLFNKCECCFSRFIEGSELSKINQNIGRPIKVSSRMIGMLERCADLFRVTEGYFDPRIIEALEQAGYDRDFKEVKRDERAIAKRNVKSRIYGELGDDVVINRKKRTVVVRRRIDVTGAAKGFIVDSVASEIKANGFKDFLVDAGGDMYAAGKNTRGTAWRIGLEDIDEERVLIALTDAGIATSGIDRKSWIRKQGRAHHLINPKNPDFFSFKIRSVTAVAKSTTEADGLAKAVFLMGAEQGLKYANQRGLKIVIRDNNHNLLFSERIKDILL